MANEYITREDFMLVIGQNSGGDYREEAIDLALETASRMIDGYQGTEYYATTEERVYSPRWFDRELALDAVSTVNMVHVDRDNDGIFEETWTAGTDYYIDPPNESLDGRPGRTLVLRRLGGRRFPRYPYSFRVNGVFGWTTPPPAVVAATVLLANRFLNRFRSSPLGFMVAASNEAVTMARLGTIDPDVATLLANVPGEPKQGLVSVQLG